jgi:hypothetical protein
MMADLHIRSVAYQNRTSGENFNAYKLRLHALRSHFLCGRSGENPSDDDVLQALEHRWRVKVLSRGPGPLGFITSDNPSVWVASDEPKPRLAMMIMPVTPQLSSSWPRPIAEPRCANS